MVGVEGRKADIFLVLMEHLQNIFDVKLKIAFKLFRPIFTDYQRFQQYENKIGMGGVMKEHFCLVCLRYEF